MSVRNPPDWTMEPPDRPPDRRAGGRTLVGVVCGLALLAALAVVLLTATGGGSGDGELVEALSSTTTRPGRGTPPTTTAAPATTSTTPVPTSTAAPSSGGDGALCIGDSVMLGASPTYLGTLTMCGTVDAEESRQMAEGLDALRAHAPYPATVVVHLGTNGTVERADLEAVLNELRDVPTVVLVTVQLNGGRPWEAQVNAEILAAASRWPNVRVADWKAASGGHPEYFNGDGVHLSQIGAQAYAEAIAAAVPA